MKICEYCGATFSPTGTYQRFCNDECREKAVKERRERAKILPAKKCAFCGKEYVPKTTRSRFCSDACRIKASNGRQKKKNGNKVCKICGKTFYAVHGREKYCGSECREKARILTALASNERQKKKRSPVICANCGKEFLPNRNVQKYCSVDCRSAHNGKLKELKVTKCQRCGKEFMQTAFNQKYCSKECMKAINRERARQTYRYKKDEGIEKPKKKKKKYSTKEWNALTSSERWELMTLNEVAVENRKYHISTYGKSEAMARWGKLPEEYGKRNRKNG